MSKEKDEWIESVFESMSGSRRAKPQPDLLAKIDAEIDASAIRGMPLLQRRFAIAASILILLLNAYAFVHLSKHKSGDQQMTITNKVPNKPLISNYKIYK